MDLEQLETAACLQVAAALRAADIVASGKSDIAEIAQACGANVDALTRVLRHLVSKGYFEEPSPGRFVMNDAARGLTGLFGRMTGAWATFLDTVRTGRPAYDFWADLAAHPEIDAEFDALMGPSGHGVSDPDILLTDDEWRSVRTFVDVGGGTGAMIAEVLRDRPWIRGILVDRPATIERARQSAYSDRVTYVAQSFFDPLPRGGDIYLISKTLGDWGDADAVKLLRRLAEAASPAGRIVIAGGVTGADRASLELLMLALVGGKSWTLPEFTDLARKAGLEIVRAGTQKSNRYVVICKPVAA